jgi:hypothetical protein
MDGDMDDDIDDDGDLDFDVLPARLISLNFSRCSR